MFVINHLFGTILVQPDWDAYIQMSVRMMTLGASAWAVTYIADVKTVLHQAEGILYA